MKRYIEFYQLGHVTGEPIPAVGNDSIAYLDARLSLEHQKAQAERIAKQRGFSGYRIMAYPILPERPLTQLITL